MQNLIVFLCSAVICSVVISQEKEETGFKPIFNGESLEGWKSAHSKGADDWGPFSVNKEEKAIHVYAGAEADSKQKSDCLNSEKEYSRFILKMEYKWMGDRFAPRTDWDRDAGLLFHVHGDLTKVWPLSLEMQIGESGGDKKHGKGNQGRFHTGDLFVLGKDLRTDTKKTRGHYDEKGRTANGRSVATKFGKERPKGEWNEMEIRVYGSEKAIFIFNGEVVLETTNFTQKNKDGERVPLDKGRIGLQAEWAEIMYRNIRIKELGPEQTE